MPNRNPVSRKGRPNLNKQALIELLKTEYPGYEPVLEMARSAMRLTEMAKENDRTDDEDYRHTLWVEASKAHDKVAAYVTPKLKAIELTGPDGAALDIDGTIISKVLPIQPTKIVFVGPEGTRDEAYMKYREQMDDPDFLAWKEYQAEKATP